MRKLTIINKTLILIHKPGNTRKTQVCSKSLLEMFEDAAVDNEGVEYLQKSLELLEDSVVANEGVDYLRKLELLEDSVC